MYSNHKTSTAKSKKEAAKKDDIPEKDVPKLTNQDMESVCDVKDDISDDLKPDLSGNLHRQPVYFPGHRKLTGNDIVVIYDRYFPQRLTKWRWRT